MTLEPSCVLCLNTGEVETLPLCSTAVTTLPGPEELTTATNQTLPFALLRLSCILEGATGLESAGCSACLKLCNTFTWLC